MESPETKAKGQVPHARATLGTLIIILLSTLGASVFRSMREGGSFMESFDLRVPGSVNEDKKSYILQQEALDLNQIEVRNFPSGKYTADELLMNVVPMEGSDGKKRNQNFAVDIYVVHGEGVQVETGSSSSGLEEAAAGDHHLLLGSYNKNSNGSGGSGEDDGMHTDLFVICIATTTHSQQQQRPGEACEHAVRSHIEHERDALLERWENSATVNSLLPSSLAREPGAALKCKVTFLTSSSSSSSSGGGGGSDSSHLATQYILQYIQSTLQTLEGVGALPAGASINHQLSPHEYEDEGAGGLLYCGRDEFGASSEVDVDVVVDLPSVLLLSMDGSGDAPGPLTKKQCSRSSDSSNSKIIIASARASEIHNDDDGAAAAAAAAMTDRAIRVDMTAYHVGLALRSHAGLAPPPSTMQDDSGGGDGDDVGDIITYLPHMGAIHPWELVAWRQASSRRLWERLHRALPALTASLDLSGTPTPHSSDSSSISRIATGSPAAVTAAELQESLEALAAQAQATTTASGPTSSAASTFALLLRACRQCHSLLHAPSLLPELFFPFEQQASVYAPFWIPVLAPVLKAGIAMLRG